MRRPSLHGRTCSAPAQPTRPANPQKSAVRGKPQPQGSADGRRPRAAPLSAQIAEPCACSRIDHAIDDNVVPTWCRTLSPASQLPPSGPSVAFPGDARTCVTRGAIGARAPFDRRLTHVRPDCAQCRTFDPKLSSPPSGLAACPGRRQRRPAWPGAGCQLCRRGPVGPGQDLPGRRYPAERRRPLSGEPGHLERATGPSYRCALLHQPRCLRWQRHQPAAGGQPDLAGQRRHLQCRQHGQRDRHRQRSGRQRRQGRILPRRQHARRGHQCAVCGQLDNASAGSHTLRAVATDNNNATSSTATITITVNAAGGDTTAPSVPGGLAGTRTANSIALSWSPSTDNTGGSGLAGYDVYRNGSLVGSPSSASYVDGG